VELGGLFASSIVNRILFENYPQKQFPISLNSLLSQVAPTLKKGPHQSWIFSWRWVRMLQNCFIPVTVIYFCLNMSGATHHMNKEVQLETGYCW